MKNGAWKTYGFWVAFTEAVGGISALMTRKGMEFFSAAVTKPPFTPPPAAFGIAWAILYLLMAVGMARVWLRQVNKAESKSLYLYLLQLTFNFIWSLIFFNFQGYLIAFLWLIALWLLILQMTRAFGEIDVTAARLQIPYLLWVAFAGYLNFGVWFLNR